ncbi:uncharacterized protein LOC135479606 isoform X2 [Liolophura sinensis]
MGFGSTCSVMVYKVLVGRPRHVVPREKLSDVFLDPTPNHECHLSCVKPRLGDTSFDLLERSTVYLYEYDESTWPVSHPRQCLPYAIVTYCSSRVGTQAPSLKIDTCVKELAGRHSSGPSKEVKPSVKMDPSKMCLKRLKAGSGLKLKILQKEYLRRAAMSQREPVYGSNDKISDGSSKQSGNYISVNVEHEESPSDAFDCAHDNIAERIEGSAPEFALSAYPRGDECLSDECPVPAVNMHGPHDNTQNDGDGCSGRTSDKVFPCLQDTSKIEPSENKTKQVDNFLGAEMEKGYSKRPLKVKAEMHRSDRSSDKGYRKSKKLKVKHDARSTACFGDARKRKFVDKCTLRKEFPVTRKRSWIDSRHNIRIDAPVRQVELPKFVYNVGSEDIDYTDIDFDVNDEASDVNLVESEMEISDDECPVKEDMNQTVQKSIHHVLVEYKTLPGKQSSVSRRGMSEFPRKRNEFYSTYQYTLDGKTYVYVSRFSKPVIMEKSSQMNYESIIDEGKTYYYNDWNQFEAGNPRKKRGPVLQKKSVNGCLDNGSECMSGGKKLSTFEALNKLRCLLSEVGQCTIDTSTIVDILNTDTVVPTNRSIAPCNIGVEQDANQSQSRHCDTKLCGSPNKVQLPFEGVQSERDIQSEKISNDTRSLALYSETDTNVSTPVKSGFSGLKAGISEKSDKGDVCEKIERHRMLVPAAEQVCKPSMAVKRVKCNRPLTCPFNSILPTTFKWKLEKLDLPVDVDVSADTSWDTTTNYASADKGVKPKFNGRTLLKGGVNPRNIPLKISRKVLESEMAVDPRLIKPFSSYYRQPRRQLSSTSETGSSLSSVSSVDSGLPDIDRYDVKNCESTDSVEEVTKPRKSTYFGMDDISLRIYDLITRHKTPDLGKQSCTSCDSSYGGSSSRLEQISRKGKAGNSAKVSKSSGCINQTGNKGLMLLSHSGSVLGTEGHGRSPKVTDTLQREVRDHVSSPVKKSFEENHPSDPKTFSGFQKGTGFQKGKRSYEVKFQNYSNVARRSEMVSPRNRTKPEGFYQEQCLDLTSIPMGLAQSLIQVKGDVFETLAGECRSDMFAGSRCLAFSGNRHIEVYSNSMPMISHQPVYDARQ